MTTAPISAPISAPGVYDPEFEALRQIDAGLLEVGYVDVVRRTAGSRSCCTAGRTTSTATRRRPHC